MDGVKPDRTQGGHAGLPHISHLSQSTGISVVTIMGLLYAYRADMKMTAYVQSLMGIFNRGFKFFIRFQNAVTTLPLFSSYLSLVL